MYGKRLPIVEAGAGPGAPPAGATSQGKAATFEFLTTRKDE